MWITLFFSNRIQSLVVDGVSSSLCEITFGVLQGLVFGPVFFLLHINDLAIDIQSTVRLFSDDYLIYHTIYTPLDHNLQ